LVAVVVVQALLIAQFQTVRMVVRAEVDLPMMDQEFNVLVDREPQVKVIQVAPVYQITG
jgi:hypothetical protein